MTMTPHAPNTQSTQAAPTQPSSTALALSNDVQFRLALEPQSFTETMQACEMFAQIQLCGCTTASEVLVRVMAGRALGLTFMASMQGIYVVDGKPGLYAELMAALCLQSPLCEEFRVIEATPQKATVRAKRRGKESQDISFDIEQARAAGLVDRGETDAKKKANNWNRFPADMLIARATGRAAKRVFPDVIRGMSSIEELEDGGRDEELVGEVVTPSVPDAPKRDFAAESKALIAKAEAITEEVSPAARKVIREEILAWDGPDSYKKTAVDVYNASPKYVRKAADAAPPAPPAPAAAPPAESKPQRQPGEEG